MESDDISRQVREIGEKAKADAVFGESRVIGDATIIPVARVGLAFGFGAGKAAKGDDEKAGAQEAGGGGGGGKLVAKPVGCVVVKGGEVTMRPVIDWNPLIAAGAVALGIAAIAGAWLLLRKKPEPLQIDRPLIESALEKVRARVAKGR